MMVIEFDWDSGNITKKEQKHGITHAEIEEIFFVDPIVKSDEKHSQNEERFIAFGTTICGKRMHVSFTIRVIGFKLRLRPISARPMNKKEREEYEKTISKIQK